MRQKCSAGNDDEIIVTMFVDDERSVNDIALRCRISPITVRRVLRKNGVSYHNYKHKEGVSTKVRGIVRDVRGVKVEEYRGA